LSLNQNLPIEWHDQDNVGRTQTIVDESKRAWPLPTCGKHQQQLQMDDVAFPVHLLGHLDIHNNKPEQLPEKCNLPNRNTRCALTLQGKCSELH
jgi:hypothetical protein